MSRAWGSFPVAPHYPEDLRSTTWPVFSIYYAHGQFVTATELSLSCSEES